MVKKFSLLEDIAVLILVSFYVLPVPLPLDLLSTPTDDYLTLLSETLASSQSYRSEATSLAFTTVFSTVAPEKVYAQTEPLITNFVYTSQNTGGVSKKGQDGEDGRDGKAGQNGTAGQNGKSVSTADSQSSASVKIKTTEAGVMVQDEVYTDEALEDAKNSLINPTSSLGSNTMDQTNTNFGGEQSDPITLKALREALASLQLMLVKYVSFLF
jgi:hypothetical protein